MTEIIPDSASPELSPEPKQSPPLAEFVEGSSSGVTAHNDPDLDRLVSKLQAAASFDEDNVWTQAEGDQWSF